MWRDVKVMWRNIGAIFIIMHDIVCETGGGVRLWGSNVGRVCYITYISPYHLHHTLTTTPISCHITFISHHTIYINMMSCTSHAYNAHITLHHFEITSHPYHKVIWLFITSWNLNGYLHMIYGDARNESSDSTLYISSRSLAVFNGLSFPHYQYITHHAATDMHLVYTCMLYGCVMTTMTAHGPISLRITTLERLKYSSICFCFICYKY